MTFDFSKIKADTDDGKCIPVLSHKFEYKDVTFECEYFKAGEKMGFISTDSNTETASINFRKVFAKKVKNIENLIVSVTDERTGKVVQKEIPDAKTMLGFPANAIFDDYITAVSSHLFAADDLTETEIKN